MKGIFVFVALSLLTTAKAECPNACSGHGRCTNFAAQFSTGMEQPNKLPVVVNGNYGYDADISKKDSCTCFSKTGFDGSEVYAWGGADCSEKICAHGPAYGGLPGADNDHTQIVECSGQGICDRGTGICQCNPGFTGQGCSRTACPNDCSGKGECKTLRQIAADVAASNGNFLYSTSAVSYDSAFDASQSRGCVCDSGRRGPDCSIIECPSSADPMGGNGSESGRPCSGRGLCEEGLCQCFSGFFGTSCDKQRANVA